MRRRDLWVNDIAGQPIYVGDYVRCEVSSYPSIAHHEQRRVQRIYEGRITLRNELSPIGTSDYEPTNFRRITRHNPAHREVPMINHLHIALLMNPDESSAVQVMARVNHYPIPTGHIIADTSFEGLKRQVSARIRANPEERWLCLNGNTIASIDQPPVAFRTW